MIAVAELVLAVAWTFGANGFLVAQPFHGSEGLPAAWLRPVSARTRVVFHDRADWSMAFYVPSPDAGATPAAAPSADGPRIFLFAPYYLAPGGLVPAAHLPVDVAEYYFHAVLEGRLDLEIRRPDAAYRRFVRERAEELMSDVPARVRQTAYLAAVSDFGAHLLSIANEIARAALRQNGAGRDLCGLIGQPASLFGLWERSFSEGAYPGHYLDPGETTAGAAPRWGKSRQSLARRDKEMLLREILRAGWSGEAARDFAWLCPQSVFDRDAPDAGRSRGAGVLDIGHGPGETVDQPHPSRLSAAGDGGHQGHDALP